MIIKQTLETLANFLLDKNSKELVEPTNYSNRDFMNGLIIFQEVLMDKIYKNQNYDNMNLDDRLKMVEQCGNDLRKFIHTYTNLDTHNVEDFI